MPPLRDLTGQRFTRLVAIERGPNLGVIIRWLCRCDCGTEKLIRAESLLSEMTRSCGCLQRETVSRGSHRKTYTREYTTWQSMKQRTAFSRYKNYRGRGILVCDRWLNSFENFYADMGPRPIGTSLDRINNNGIYEPGNCRWATVKQQARNTRRNHYATAFGRTMIVTDWAAELGVSVGHVINSIRRKKGLEYMITKRVRRSLIKNLSRISGVTIMPRRR